ncbi:MAG TPA: U32 family peptidase [Epulopiscium sp.]|nr:U32 family peptidase [Candidatus Epulonipiscium sp.]
MKNNTIELLAPAGNLEALKIAILYGADAVYMGGHHYGLRAKARNFTPEQMQEGIDFVHEHGKKVYITANIIAHNDDFEGMAEYFKEIEQMGADAIIVADPGVFMIAKEAIPNMEIHLSTQANNTNYHSALFWAKQGIERIVVARELSFKEIKEMREKLPEDVTIEAFVHGAMCISYSGRCLMSNYLTDRDANKGECSHPCRWEYNVVEKTRPGEYMPVEETERGTFIYNSRDLCMIEFIPELIESGITSLKIEGRMKTAFYAGTVIKAYREAIDTYLRSPEEYEQKKSYFLEEVSKASHREYTTGFYNGKTTSSDQTYTHNAYIRNYDFAGMIIDFNEETGMVTVEQRRKFSVGDDIEVMPQNEPSYKIEITHMWDEEGNSIDSAPHPKQKVKFKVSKPILIPAILRKVAD